MRLSLHHISAGYRRKQVLHDISLDLKPRAITGIIGPNGCGKSTMLKVMGSVLKPLSGAVTLDGLDLMDWSACSLARKLARLPQIPTAPPGISVKELVALGRHPHQRWYRRHSETDATIIREAIRQCSLEGLADRDIQTLSGGERQRAWIAMTLAQQPSILLLDEPTSALDIHHQLEVLDLLADLNQQTGLTVAIVMHDINLALRYCQQIVMVDAGNIVADCPAERVTPETLQPVFQVSAVAYKGLNTTCCQYDFARLGE